MACVVMAYVVMALCGCGLCSYGLQGGGEAAAGAALSVVAGARLEVCSRCVFVGNIGVCSINSYGPL